MSYTEYCGASFGRSRTGLATVGYRLYDTEAAPVGARVTAGIGERGPGTYAAIVTFPDEFVGELRWDTGEGAPRYVSLFINPAVFVSSAAERNAIADAIFDRLNGVETDLTLRHALRGIVAVLLGKSSNGGDTFRDFNDTKNRISATVDANDNRTAVARDLT